MLSSALEYAAQNVPVFPLFGVADGVCDCRAGSECKSPGKHPLARLTPRGVNDATTDPTIIRRWFTAEPRANLGAAMGGQLRLIALDIDPRNGGDASLCDLVEAHGSDWLNTLTIKTGGLGNHFLFRLPEGVEVHRGKLAPGVDVKAAGGYLVAPPSVHATGRKYEVERNMAVADCPAWLLQELTLEPGQSPGMAVNYQERREPSSSFSARTFLEGERNDGLRDVSYGRWRGGWATDEADLVQQLLEVNATRCVPPLETSTVIEMARRCARKFTPGERPQGVSA